MHETRVSADLVFHSLFLVADMLLHLLVQLQHLLVVLPAVPVLSNQHHQLRNQPASSTRNVAVKLIKRSRSRHRGSMVQVILRMRRRRTTSK